MSRIPNSAMPHASAKDAALETETESGERSAFGQLTDQLTDKVREYPKTAAAGAAVVVGLATAAAIPAIRGRSKKSASSSRKRK